ncbi:Phosphopantothenoylcysteine decarboxylase homolog [Nocardiopsis sp. JB363]|nr:Phosphopantothenoylcysteine decarboxylase homolog [Nocardiopsis sp. JB363]
MPDSVSERKTLYVVVCAAGPASDVGKLVDLAQEQGWTVQVMATPSAVSFIDVEALEKQTGRLVRSQHRAPGEPRSPKADAIIIAPATFNTINKLANGIADNYVLDVVNEAIGLGVPTVVLPFINSAYMNREPMERSIRILQEENVKILIGEEYFEPHPPGSGGSNIKNFPWEKTLIEIRNTGHALETAKPARQNTDPEIKKNYQGVGIASAFILLAFVIVACSTFFNVGTPWRIAAYISAAVLGGIGAAGALFDLAKIHNRESLSSFGISILFAALTASLIFPIFYLDTPNWLSVLLWIPAGLFLLIFLVGLGMGTSESIAERKIIMNTERQGEISSQSIRKNEKGTPERLTRENKITLLVGAVTAISPVIVAAVQIYLTGNQQ